MSVAPTDSYITAHEKAVEGICKAFVAANAFILNPKNREAVIRVLGKYLRVDRSDTLDEHYKAALENAEKKPFVSMEAIASMIHLMAVSDPEVGRLKAESVVYKGIMERIDRSGFIDQLYRPY